ncbi:hypothetical protein D9M68_884380 [compost metagenome]
MHNGLQSWRQDLSVFVVLHCHIVDGGSAPFVHHNLNAEVVEAQLVIVLLINLTLSIKDQVGVAFLEAVQPGPDHHSQRRISRGCVNVTGMYRISSTRRDKHIGINHIARLHGLAPF